MMVGMDVATTWNNEPEQESVCIGRMTSEAGKRIEIMETAFRDDSAKHYSVTVNSLEVYSDWNGDKAAAIRVARWWMDGCRA